MTAGGTRSAAARLGDWTMRFASVTALVNRVFGWADGVQRRHGVLGFPYGGQEVRG